MYTIQVWGDGNLIMTAAKIVYWGEGVGISSRHHCSPGEPFLLWTVWDLSGCDYCVQSSCSLLILFLGVSGTDKIYTGI